jgi:hypothetical protein
MNQSFLSRLFFKHFAWFISIFFHPLLMPFLGIYIILNCGNLYLITVEGKSLILTITILCTFVIPIAFLPLLYFQKLVSSFTLNDKQERVLPLIITFILYYFSFYIFRRLGVPLFIQAFQLASTLSVLVTLLITLKWKVSSHLVGIGGIIGLIFILLFYYHSSLFLYLIAALFLAGCIGFARLSLNEHTPSQVYVGLAVGLLVMVGTLILY